MTNPNNVIRNILGTPKRGGRKDLDGDGIPNWKDCQPRNTMRQDGSSSWYKIKLKARFSHYGKETLDVWRNKKNHNYLKLERWTGGDTPGYALVLYNLNNSYIRTVSDDLGDGSGWTNKSSALEAAKNWMKQN